MRSIETNLFLAKALLHVAMALCFAKLANCANNGSDYQLISTNCINSSHTSAVVQQMASTERHCTYAANSHSGHLVASFNANTSQCTVFHYQSVCHLIHAANATNNNHNKCSVFGRLPIQVKNISVLNGVQQKVRAAWVFGASGQENASLVCAKWPVQWQPKNISWTEEGAVFDGSNSGMTLGRSDFGNFSAGFTWLLRLKRQEAKKQILMRRYECGETMEATHFWEWDDNSIYYRGFRNVAPSKYIITSRILPSDLNEFFNFAVTGFPSPNTDPIFYNGSYVTAPHATDTPETILEPGKTFECISLGFNPTSGEQKLNGTVQAVAIANAGMTEQEIDSLFELMMVG